MSLIFVDVEADFNSPCPGLGEGMTEFGAVEFDTLNTFYGLPDNTGWVSAMEGFAQWMKQFKGYPIFVSDNPAYDWQWINYHFWHSIGKNPFGHSARRIGDFYAGLVGDFRSASKWKALRVTKHDHNRVNDAMGNVEAFRRMLSGERH